jgi:hypothetical protein
MSKLSVADGFSIGISLCALIISGVLALLQYWPSYETRAMVSRSYFSIEDGRFGAGPRLVAVVNFVNSGNRPIILTSISASFGLATDGNIPSSCETRGGNWVSLPWMYSDSHGEGFSEALPRVINPGSATATVAAFDSLPLSADGSDQPQASMVCIVYEVLDPNGAVVMKRAPLGVVEFSSAQVIDFKQDAAYRQPILISE